MPRSFCIPEYHQIEDTFSQDTIPFFWTAEKAAGHAKNTDAKRGEAGLFLLPLQKTYSLLGGIKGIFA